MEQIQIKKTDFKGILNTAELLIDKVEDSFSQYDVIKKRMKDITTGKVKGKTENGLNAYLSKRGIQIE